MPVQVFEKGSSEDRGENARLSSFVGAIAICDLVKSTLGPKGMDKILQSGSNPEDLQITNDGATILKSIYVDNGAAKVLIDISKVQDDEVGDGTTSVCVLAGEILREGEKLIGQQIHPQTIVRGWREATDVARAALVKAATDHSQDEEAFKKDLIDVARTTLSSKILTQEKSLFASLAVDAVLKLNGSTDLEHIKIIKKPGGSLKDSYLDRDGFLLEKKIGVGCPHLLEGDIKILVANTPMDSDKVKIFGSRVKADSTNKVAEIEAAERDKMRRKCDKILSHNINVFVNRQLIYNLPEGIFAQAGVMSIEHADFDGIERLALVTGGEIASTFDEPGSIRLGTCKKVEEIIIGEDKLIRFSGLSKPEACTIVLRGASSHVLDEAERSLHDALCVLSQMAQEKRTVLGAGCSEMIMAKAIDEAAAKTSGKQALAMEAFAHALRQIPSIICDNGGYDASDLCTKLRACHALGQNTMGLDMKRGQVADVGASGELKITESFKVKEQVLLSASEAAEMIMRVDEIIRRAPRQREG